jgi:hypothetical protein
VLGGLGLDLAGGGDVRNQREVHEAAHVLGPSSSLICRIASRNGRRLDVADRAADFDHRDIGIAAPSATRRLISSVMCGMTCTVPPR